MWKNKTLHCLARQLDHKRRLRPVLICEFFESMAMIQSKGQRTAFSPFGLFCDRNKSLAHVFLCGMRYIIPISLSGHDIAGPEPGGSVVVG